MSIVQLKEGNCQNCYKCIRNCPVKSIEFKNGNAAVIEKECILCGECIACCPQNTKYARNDISEVRALLSAGHPVAVSLAPSWKAYYENVGFDQMSGMLKKLGFSYVEETAIGASQVSREYDALLDEGRMENIIFTACSSVVMLVERHYPSLIRYLAPVSSPMMAHARLMRECYGDIRVVFIGPCYSKKNEASDPLAGGLVNNAITFEELDGWMEEQQFTFAEDGCTDADVKGVKDYKARVYPTACGILETLQSQDKSYRRIAIDGVEDCMELFHAMETEGLTGLAVEANVCKGSCIGGPVMRKKGKHVFVARQYIEDKEMPYDRHYAVTADAKADHPRAFTDRRGKSAMPTEAQIRAILEKTGKYTPEQELNCGSCGYNSCREKAIAVFQGKADINMCLPFFRERAENISNTILSNSPNAIFAIDSDLFVQDLNETAERMFGIRRQDYLNMPVSEFIADDLFDRASRSDVPVIEKVKLREDFIVEETVTYIPQHKIYVAFIKNITADELSELELAKMREHTIEVAQNVIDKQMRVAQEIASLLGETTAETKVALTTLKKSMEEVSEPLEPKRQNEEDSL